MRSIVSAIVVGFLLVGPSLWAKPWKPEKARAATEFQKGIALGLFGWEPDWDYAGLLDEIVQHGATDVELVVPWVQQDLRSTRIEPREHISPTESVIRRTIRQAHERGLRVMLFPIIRVQDRAPGEWRGKIQFRDSLTENAWWTAYRAFILEMARIAGEEHAERLSIGSELLKLEGERARWRRLIDDVRQRFRGRVLYSGNWDHYAQVSFWDSVDEVGMTAYFELTKRDSPTVEEIREGWLRWTRELAEFSRSVGKPVVFTEVGYPSLDGANRFPWDETRRSRVDLAEQADCYRALADVVTTEKWLSGVYVWNWFGPGGVHDGDYTPRGKPAADVVRGMFDGIRR